MLLLVLPLGLRAAVEGRAAVAVGVGVGLASGLPTNPVVLAIPYARSMPGPTIIAATNRLDVVVVALAVSWAPLAGLAATPGEH